MPFVSRHSPVYFLDASCAGAVYLVPLERSVEQRSGPGCQSCQGDVFQKLTLHIANIITLHYHGLMHPVVARSASCMRAMISPCSGNPGLVHATACRLFFGQLTCKIILEQHSGRHLLNGHEREPVPGNALRHDKQDIGHPALAAIL